MIIFITKLTVKTYKTDAHFGGRFLYKEYTQFEITA